jgi:hypothetical protein
MKDRAISAQGPASIEWYIEDLAPPHLPLLQVLSFRRCSLLKGEGMGRGWGRNRIMQRRESLVLYKSSITLCQGLLL